jgi:hypothetical protein
MCADSLEQKIYRLYTSEIREGAGPKAPVFFVSFVYNLAKALNVQSGIKS